jgi:hypothetical protein
MSKILVTLDRLDAQILLPLILEQSADRVGTTGGAYWLGLHGAIVEALAADPASGPPEQ